MSQSQWWRVRRTTAFVSSGSQRTIALDLATPSASPLALEGSAAVVWSALIGRGGDRVTVSTESLVRVVADQYGVTESEVVGGVTEFLGCLEAAGLIERIDEAPRASRIRSRNKPPSAGKASGDDRISAGDVSSAHTAGVLRPSEAIELAYALGGQVAQISGGRALALKGLVGVMHGLRPHRVPADADFLVAPEAFDQFLQELELAGWRPRLGPYNDLWGQHHSVTMINDDWPCDIDVHRWFPGFLAHPDTVYQVLERSACEMPVAGQKISALGQASSILVMALHALRSSPDNDRHVEELKHLQGLALQFDDGIGAELRAIAVDTGADVALAGTLAEFGVPATRANPVVDPDALRQWRYRSEGRATDIGNWLRFVRGGPPQQWLTRIWVAAWPPDDLMNTIRDVRPGRWALTEARLARLVRGVGAVPSSIMTALGLRTRSVQKEAESSRRGRASQPGSRNTVRDRRHRRRNVGGTTPADRNPDRTETRP